MPTTRQNLACCNNIYLENMHVALRHFEGHSPSACHSVLVFQLCFYKAAYLNLVASGFRCFFFPPHQTCAVGREMKQRDDIVVNDESAQDDIPESDPRWVKDRSVGGSFTCCCSRQNAEDMKVGGGGQDEVGHSGRRGGGVIAGVIWGVRWLVLRGNTAE